MLPTGVSHMVCGLVKLSQSSLPHQSGYISQPTLFSSIMFSPDLRANSLRKSQLMEATNSIALLITGCMRSPLTKCGISLRRCIDGSDGTMVLT